MQFVEIILWHFSTVTMFLLVWFHLHDSYSISINKYSKQIVIYIMIYIFVFWQYSANSTFSTNSLYTSGPGTSAWLLMLAFDPCFGWDPHPLIRPPTPLTRAYTPPGALPSQDFPYPRCVVKVCKLLSGYKKELTVVVLQTWDRLFVQLKVAIL